MSDFNAAVLTVLQHEGGYVNDSQDSGGETNFGVSLRFLKGLRAEDGDINHDGVIDGADIRTMSKEEAIEIYRKNWWDKYKYGLIADQSLATKVFDLSVNMGSTQAHKILQRAIMACSDSYLMTDGKLGPKTLRDCNNCDPAELLKAIKEQAAYFYRSLNKPRYLTGWLRRAYA